MKKSLEKVRLRKKEGKKKKELLRACLIKKLLVNAFILKRGKYKKLYWETESDKDSIKKKENEKKCGIDWNF